MTTIKPRSRASQILIASIATIVALAGIAHTANSRSTTQPQAQASPQAVQHAPAPKTYVKVAELSGNANKRSDVFRLAGGKQRITYTVAGQYSPTVYVYLVPEGKSLERDGGFPEVMATTNGETMGYESAGNYYLDVSAVATDWTILIEEER